MYIKFCLSLRLRTSWTMIYREVNTFQFKNAREQYVMNKEPVKRHYILQFILRKFCFDGRSYLYYFDKKTTKTFKRKTTDVFMIRNLYRDDINNMDAPARIEKDMACLESEVA